MMKQALIDTDILSRFFRRDPYLVARLGEYQRCPLDPPRVSSTWLPSAPLGRLTAHRRGILRFFAPAEGVDERPAGGAIIFTFRPKKT
ncbi:MAG: hypothetical protein WAT23_03365 [Chromatiaceae bacterium]